MIPVLVLGPVPEEVLEAAGARPDPNADLVLFWTGQPEAEARARRTRTRMVVAIAPSAREAERALQQGAIDALVWPGDRPQMAARLRVAARAARVARTRVRHHERRARQVSEELASAQDLLGRLIDATPNPIVAADLRGRLLVFNRAAERALGYESAWAREHLRIDDLYADPEDARRVRDALRRSPGGIAEGLRLELRGRSGEPISVSLSAAEVYGPDGMPMAVIGVFQDLRVVESLRSRLEATTEQLVASERRTAELGRIREAVHEMNQALMAALGTLEILALRDDLGDEPRARLERLHAQLDRLAEAVRVLERRTRPQGVEYARRS